jgi:hypothetical protein
MLGLRYETTDDQLPIMKIVQGAGTGFAFPSRTLYVGRDRRLDGALRGADGPADPRPTRR